MQSLDLAFGNIFDAINEHDEIPSSLFLNAFRFLVEKDPEQTYDIDAIALKVSEAG